MDSTDGINSMALQQGGLGLLLSTLIVMAPPMAAAFFQGTLGNFASYSSFGGIGAGSAMAQRQQALAQGRAPAAPVTQQDAGGGTMQNPASTQNYAALTTPNNFGPMADETKIRKT